MKRWIGLLALLLAGCTTNQCATQRTKIIGNGKIDDTAAIQSAMDAIAKKGGGTLQLPAGQFLLAHRLNIPSTVTLQGVFESVPAHNGMRDKGFPKPTDDGTCLLLTADAGTEDAPAAITLNTNSTLRGVCIFYPNQTLTDVPTPYPWAVAMRGKNPATLDCEILNAYNAIDATQNERHLIRNISGQPLRRGVWVDEIYDIGRIENVHFNPWFSNRSKLYQFEMDHGEAFIFGRSDWEYVLNCFCYGYHDGYHFVQTKTGVCNGNFLGIGADDCQTSVQIDAAAIYGLLITNGEFTAFHGPDPTMVRVADTNSGVARFVNCAFWGPCNQIAKIEGTGMIGFSDCTFVQWNVQRHAIQARGGTVMVQNCTFGQPHPQVLLGEKLRKAVVTGNVMTGPIQIENDSHNAVIANNVADQKQ